MTERQSLTILDRPVPRGTHMCVFDLQRWGAGS
jgi:hypothetical protein